MLYRYKVGLFAGVVACFTSVIVYITGPKDVEGPVIRVLYISFSEEDAVKRSIGAVKSFFNPDGSLELLPVSEDGSVVIDREDYDLKWNNEASIHQTNIVLECTASFPVAWTYSGFGEPEVTEKNVRIHGDFNDSSTFTYLSILNLMPLTEKSTGKYTCFGVSNLTSEVTSSVHLYVPGEVTFLIDFDTIVDVQGGDKILIPCPVTNSSANITLYHKNQAIKGDEGEHLISFDPKTGFHLKPKFVEQTEPWGPYFCRNDETKERSGTITIQPVKDLVVNVIPDSETVHLSTSSKDEDLSQLFKFVCQAKEEVTLKFLRVVKLPMVQFEYNASSIFPFSAYTEVTQKSLKNMSKIYCRTVRGNSDLHLWKVLFAAQSMRTEAMDLLYDEGREDFSCCGSPSNKRAKLVAVNNCHSISECRIQAACLLEPGRKCNPERISKIQERTGCVSHKLWKEKNGREEEDVDDELSKSSSITALNSGLLQCSIDGKSMERIFFGSRYNTRNASHVSVVSGEVSSPLGGGDLRLSVGDSHKILEIEEIFGKSRINVTKIKGSKRKFRCRGAKFFLAAGFVWQTIHANGQNKFHYGRDKFKGAWIQSEMRIKSFSRGEYMFKRVYCSAPIWNSDGDWAHAKFDVL